MRTKQKGMGISEVVVATVLLTVGVGAMLGVQLRALDASTDGLKSVEAMQIARDFIENVRTNPSQHSTYFSQSRTVAAISSAGAGINCYTTECTPAQKAKWDLTEMHTQAKNQGFSLLTLQCPVNTTRNCIFVSWGQTTPTVGANSDSPAGGSNIASTANCAVVNSGKLVYHEEAKCIFLEAF